MIDPNSVMWRSMGKEASTLSLTKPGGGALQAFGDGDWGWVPQISSDAINNHTYAYSTSILYNVGKTLKKNYSNFCILF